MITLYKTSIELTPEQVEKLKEARALCVDEYMQEKDLPGGGLIAQVIFGWEDKATLRVAVIDSETFLKLSEITATAKHEYNQQVNMFRQRMVQERDT